MVKYFLIISSTFISCKFLFSPVYSFTYIVMVMDFYFIHYIEIHCSYYLLFIIYAQIAP